MGSNIIYWDGRNAVKLPEKISVDTNIALAASIKGHRLNQISMDFVNYCTQNNVRLYFPGIHSTELKHQLELAVTKDIGENNYKLKYGEEYQCIGGYKKYYKDLVDIDEESASLIEQKVETSFQLFSKLTQNLPTVIDGEMHENISKLRRITPYTVEINDLVGVITSHDYGINTYVTNDSDFLTINNINVIKLVPDRKISQKATNIIPYTYGCIYSY